MKMQDELEATPVVIETERLRLRELADDDHAWVYAIHRDPRVSRTLGEPPPEDEFLRSSRETWPAYYRTHGFGLWAAVRKEDGAAMGRIGLLSQEVDGVREVEVAYTLGPAFWGHGYAVEAARACRDWAFRRLGVPHVISLILPDNERSIRVAERNGMTLWKEADFRGFHVRVYRITREEWARLASMER